MRANKKRALQLAVLLSCAALIGMFVSGTGMAAEKGLKAGFVYVGPVGDYGWSHAHDMGRKYAEKQLPWLKTVFIESVAEADSARIIDRSRSMRKTFGDGSDLPGKQSRRATDPPASKMREFDPGGLPSGSNSLQVSLCRHFEPPDQRYRDPRCWRLNSRRRSLRFALRSAMRRFSLFDM